MSVQTTTTGYTPNVGAIADDEFKRISEYACEDSTLAFGIVVQRGTADNQVKAGGTDHVGISLAKKKEMESDGTYRYNQYDSVNVLERGAVWVTIENTGDAGDDLYYNVTDGTIGAGTAVASLGQVAFPTGSKLLTDVATVGGIGKIYVINMVK